MRHEQAALRPQAMEQPRGAESSGSGPPSDAASRTRPNDVRSQRGTAQQSPVQHLTMLTPCGDCQTTGVTGPDTPSAHGGKDRQ